MEWHILNHSIHFYKYSLPNHIYKCKYIKSIEQESDNNIVCNVFSGNQTKIQQSHLLEKIPHLSINECMYVVHSTKPPPLHKKTNFNWITHTICVKLFYFISDSGRCYSLKRKHKKRALLLDLFKNCDTSYKIGYKSCNHILWVNAHSMMFCGLV